MLKLSPERSSTASRVLWLEARVRSPHSMEVYGTEHLRGVQTFGSWSVNRAPSAYMVRAEPSHPIRITLATRAHAITLPSQLTNQVLGCM